MIVGVCLVISAIVGVCALFGYALTLEGWNE